MSELKHTTADWTISIPDDLIDVMEPFIDDIYRGITDVIGRALQEGCAITGVELSKLKKDDSTTVFQTSTHFNLMPLSTPPEPRWSAEDARLRDIGFNYEAHLKQMERIDAQKKEGEERELTPGHYHLSHTAVRSDNFSVPGGVFELMQPLLRQLSEGINTMLDTAAREGRVVSSADVRLVNAINSRDPDNPCLFRVVLTGFGMGKYQLSPGESVILKECKPLWPAGVSQPKQDKGRQ